MKGTYIHALFESKCSRVLKSWHWHDFQTLHLLVQHAIIIYNSMVTKFCRLDVSLSCSVFDSNVGFTPSVFKKVLRAILAKKKMKIIVNMLWFAIRNHIFANEQKWNVGKLRSWVIKIVPHVEWTFLYFYSCHSNGALKPTLSVSFNFSNQYISRVFLKSENGKSNVFDHADTVQVLQAEPPPSFNGEWGLQKLNRRCGGRVVVLGG